MKIHVGEKIKARATELRIGSTELAKSINTSKQNIYGIYKRESIDTDLLQKFCKVLNYDFFTLFVNPKLPPNNDKKSKLQISGDRDLEYDVLKNQMEDLKEKYELIKKVNVLLEEKKKLK